MIGFCPAMWEFSRILSKTLQEFVKKFFNKFILDIMSGVLTRFAPYVSLVIFPFFNEIQRSSFRNSL